MNKSDLKSISEELLSSFLEAGKVARSISVQGIKIKIKSDKSPVTNGDLEVDKILTNKIKNLTPNIPIISEENVDLKSENKNKTFWLIDPIDGTKDYIKKRDEYTLNAALVVDQKPALGVVYAPAKDRLFYSYGNELAFEISKGIRTHLRGTKKNNAEIIGLANSDDTPNEILEIYKKNKVSKIIKMSSSLKFCIIAAGEADIYAAQARAFEWDIAAGHAILEHSGGTVTTFEGKNFSYGKKNYRNLPIIAKRQENLQR